MPMLCGAVDHRPFVQTEAAELPGTGTRAAQHEGDEASELGLLGGEALGIRRHAVGGDPGGVPAPCHPLGRVRQLHTRSGVPAAQLRGLVAVVGEEEVPHRVLLAARHTVSVRG
ncbi:unnamed protein product, partial [Penicillium discolor]